MIKCLFNLIITKFNPFATAKTLMAIMQLDELEYFAVSYYVLKSLINNM